MAIEEGERKAAVEMMIKALAATEKPLAPGITGKDFAKQIVDGAILIAAYIKDGATAP